MVVAVVQGLYSGDGDVVFGCTGIVTGGVGGRQWHCYCHFMRSGDRNGDSDGGCRGDGGGCDEMRLDDCDQLFG
ncbi:Hypothetical predicted protein [Olea europaea subsp. europaea]|uniref:Uncharacterized protein n=1 Tax=Olea europaea subsp. europaea TaxID=158383 RepID=A0A8S0T3U9_OLEEU|nr:Hypothetical predicted protein [Olea europaea subsp. europaea]